MKNIYLGVNKFLRRFTSLKEAHDTLRMLLIKPAWKEEENKVLDSIVNQTGDQTTHVSDTPDTSCEILVTSTPKSPQHELLPINISPVPKRKNVS